MARCKHNMIPAYCADCKGTTAKERQDLGVQDVGGVRGTGIKVRRAERARAR